LNIKNQLDEYHKLMKMADKDMEIIENYINPYKERELNSYDIEELKPWIRIAIRSSIVLIETICYSLKQMTLLICDHNNKHLSPKDILKLKEKRFDENGNEIDCYPRTKENIKFSLEKIIYAFDSDYDLKYDENWKNFLNTIEKRNDLTHPKTLSSFDVTLRDYLNSVNGFRWFKKQLKMIRIESTPNNNDS
jgi:hypothetical protein